MPISDNHHSLIVHVNVGIYLLGRIFLNMRGVANHSIYDGLVYLHHMAYYKLPNHSTHSNLHDDRYLK